MGCVNRLVVSQGKEKMGVLPCPEESNARNTGWGFKGDNQGGAQSQIYQEHREFRVANEIRDLRTGLQPHTTQMPKIDFLKFNGIDPKGW